MQIIIDAKYCKGCALCVSQCKQNVLVSDKLRNAMGYIVPEPINIEKCTGCRSCEWTCPDMAITVIGGKDNA